MRHHKRFCDLLGFDDRWMILIGLPISSFLISVLLFTSYYSEQRWDLLAFCLPVSFVYTGAFWVLLRAGYIQIRRQYPRFDQFRIRLAWVVPVFLLTFVVVNYVLDKVFSYVMPPNHIQPQIVSEFIGSFLLTGVMMMIYEVMSFYVLLQKTHAEKEQLVRQNVESQLEGLRNQVNPHFLFNTLNTLVYLIPEDSDKAIRFVHQLSRVYRYVLESRDAKTIPLEEELTFLEAYIFLQKERFGHNLRVNIRDLPQQNGTAIVPLTLQLLFENAIKHNIISTEKPLKIDLFAENGHLVVRNNLQPKNQQMESTGVGLQNVKDRYRLLSDRTVEVIVTPQSFVVALPILQL